MPARSEFRKAQGVVPFGVGAIIDFKDDSLMAAGLDVWPTESAIGESRTAMLAASRVDDGRLARRLSAEAKRPIRYFLSPPQAPEYGGFGSRPRLDRAPMPFVRFPNWYFCPRCRVLKHIPWNAQSGADALRCAHLGRRVEGKGAPCGSLPKYRRPNLSPVRFVVACESGHIMDFPWNEWAHKDSGKHCDGAPGDLYLYSTPAAGLAGVRVGCVKCNVNNSMSSAFRQNVLVDVYGSACPGARPWLGPDAQEPCGNVPQTIQRGASNAYFAKVVSSILIPPYSARIQQILDRDDLWGEIESLPLVEGRPHEPWLRKKAENLGVDVEAFIRAVCERLGAGRFEPPAQNEAEISEIDYRYDEYKAYVGPRPPREERHDFDTDATQVQAYGEAFAALFDRVVLVRKLRETRVLTGFSRIVPVEALKGPPAQLSIRPKDWFPGFAVRGEGIFLELSAHALEAWSAQADVVRRVARMQSRLNDVHRQRELTPRKLLPELVLMHTFSHLVIRQLAFECGYDSSSIRERLYVSANPRGRMAGLLLYTASGDSEGTLGGLVRQGEPKRLESTVRAALDNATICSSDPLCIESGGQGLFSLNLSACHSCALLPETSCEEGNLLLDRGCVVGTPDQPSLGYFRSLLS